jgi:alanine racemase/UDP-N-acetylmuramoyl-tripeptide--D-alanyl-D-alanine ligase
MDAFDLRKWSGFAQAEGNMSQAAVIDEVCIDSRRLSSPNSLFVALQGQRDGHLFVADASKKGARYAIVRKDWQPSQDLGSITLLRVENPLTALQEIAKAYRNDLPCRVIAIAGSYGKTMVKDLLQLMVSTSWQTTASPESFNSQIGVALSILTLKRTDEIALIETAISMPGEMALLENMLSPDSVIVTHLGNKHLATLGSKETLADELTLLLQSPQQGSWVLLPNSSQLTVHREKIGSAIYLWDTNENNILPHAIPIGRSSGSELNYKIDFPDGEQFLGTATTGFSYILDLLNIAVKAAWLLEIPSSAIKKCLERYTPEPMRTEIWRSPSGITFINDSYCSDPQSIDCALLRYEQEIQSTGKGRRVFVFGGLRSSQLAADYRRIGHAIAEAKLQNLLLIGNHAYDPLCEELAMRNPSTAIKRVASSQDAILWLQENLQHGDIVLIKGERKIPLNHFIEAFNDSLCSNQCLINLEAIRANIATIRSKLPPSTKVMVMVKAFAYGTDEVRMAKFLSHSNVDMLGVSYCDEAVTLRRAGIKQEIFVINAAPFEASKAARWKLTVGVSDSTLITALAVAAAEIDSVISVHLHIDTGMGRFGCRPEEALTLAREITSCDHLKLEGVFTHFAAAEDPAEDEFTLRQAKIFDAIVEELAENSIHPTWKHAANSSATLRFNFSHYNLVRIGLAAYGLYSSEAASLKLELRHALSLTTRIVGINICKKGESISYGRSYKIEKGTRRFAVLPIGYFDGLHRHYSGKGAVIIHGRPAPMVGNICMDFMMVDITDIPEASVGDPVLIFGQDEHGHNLSAEKLADQGQSIVHELITCLGPRIPRIFIHEDAKESVR